jgi:hypothetical protein
LSEIRRLERGEAARGATTLAGAFQDDPVMSWVFPRPDRRARALRDGFELFLRRVWLQHDECFATSRVRGENDGVAGAACWLPPGHWHLPAARQVALFPSLLRIGRERAPRFLRVFALAERKHARGRHWYLVAREPA